MNSFVEGAVAPLLSFWRRPLVLAGALLLAGCSHHSTLPAFTASGFAGDEGAVRIWRKDSNDEIHMLVVFSPWHQGHTSVGEYRWQDETLNLIALTLYTKPPEHIRMRFDEHSELSFMEQEVDGHKQQLSSDQIALYRYRAGQIRHTSDALREGHVVLHQGRWQGNKTVLTCEGQKIKPDLDAHAFSTIERRQSHSAVALSVAWLQAPEGSQLLLVANEDFCRWQPDEKSL